MQSFIKFIADTSVPFNPDWLNDPDKMFRSLTTSGKIYFLMQQAIILNYLDRVYDKGLPTLIKEYKEKVSKWWLLDLESEVENMDTDDNSLEKEGYLNILALLDVDSSIQIDAERCSNWAAHQMEDIPVAVKNTFYSPYLLFAERARRSETLVEGDYAQGVESFTTQGPVVIPLVSYSGEILAVDNERLTFPSYKYDYADNHKFGSTPFSLGVESIFSYWRGYNWSGYSFNGLVGVLVAQCLELDTNTFPNNSLLWGYYHVYCNTLQWAPHGAGESNLWLSSESNTYRRSVLNFLTDLHDKYKIPFDDSELLARLVKGTVEDADKLHAFLVAKDPSEVSVEMYHAFQKSVFATYNELDLTKCKRLSSWELMDVTIHAKNSDRGVSFNTQQEEDSTPGRSKRLRTSGPSKDARLSDKTFAELDEELSGGDTAQTGDEDEDATAGGETEDTGLSDNSFDQMDQAIDPEAETTPDDEPSAPEENPSEDTEDITHTQHNTQVPDESWMDDKKGVELELSNRETTNSVLFKMELEAYIDSLLANPPDFLSVMKIEAIKRIKAHWFHLLTVECLVNLLNTFIKLPKHLNLQPEDK